MLSTVSRAFEVLSLFTPDESQWGATGVARRLDLSKSSAHDLLRSLWELGMLERQPGGQYHLGLGLLALSQQVASVQPWLGAARREMAALAHQTGEIIHLSVLHHGSLLHLEDAHPPGGGEHLGVPPPGLASAQVPPQCSAMGKALLSALPWPQVLELIQRQGLGSLTVNSINTADELQTELQRVRERGYAYDVEEAFPGVCCIAVPVRGAGGQVKAAMSMSVPSPRFAQLKQERRAQLLEAGYHLERVLNAEEALLMAQ
ncbi:IclR family transcriptional regulator [Deinococcus ruber]|uniref:IclR family transcriptional regulator n=1 Tax=Deinococcus ruber TaxID=1848197 RepID=A0A918CAI5_9DEIO|nr:IclR family transcriptional regulator [Deinococcus ruber]GGR14262.1 IclR family transcriptional regulator [Deinococcus ruber]